MNVDNGKSAKRRGDIAPRDARKIDGDKPTVGLGGTVPLKNFGYTYQWRFFVRHGWRTSTHWFKTERSRDQSFDHFVGAKWDSPYYRNAKKIEKP